jgi:hypothetical protein
MDYLQVIVNTLINLRVPQEAIFRVQFQLYRIIKKDSIPLNHLT